MVVLARDIVKANIPKFNPVIANGVATEQFKELESYLLKIFRDTAKLFPDELKFLGMRRLDPLVEAKHVHEKCEKGVNRTVEIADSSIYLMSFDFEFRGEKIEHHMYLPYLVDAGRIWIRGVLNTIIPVLTAPVFSVAIQGGTSLIFLKLLAAKLTFKRMNAYSFMMNGRQSTHGIVWCQIWRGDRKKMTHYQEKKNDSVQIKHLLAIYLFMEFGVTRAFQKYAKCDVKIFMEEIPPEYRDQEKWLLCQSTNRKPITFKRGMYIPHDIALAVPRDDNRTTEENNMLYALLVGFFYIADSYALQMPSKENGKDISDFDDESFWAEILGHAIFWTNEHITTYLSQVRRHMAHVRNMLDYQQAQDIRHAGIEGIDDMFDLLAYIMANFSNIIIENDNGSLYGKRLLILRNVLEGAINGINTIQNKSLSGAELKDRAVKRDIRENLPEEKILRMQKNAYVMTIPSPSDNKAFSYTNKFLMQNNISENNSADKVNPDDPDNQLHASVLEVGSYLAVKRSEISGRQLLNPYQLVSSSGITKRNPELRPQTDYIAKMIDRG